MAQSGLVGDRSTVLATFHCSCSNYEIIFEFSFVFQIYLFCFFLPQLFHSQFSTLNSIIVIWGFILVFLRHSGCAISRGPLATHCKEIFGFFPLASETKSVFIFNFHFFPVLFRIMSPVQKWSESSDCCLSCSFHGESIVAAVTQAKSSRELIRLLTCVCSTEKPWRKRNLLGNSILHLSASLGRSDIAAWYLSCRGAPGSLVKTNHDRNAIVDEVDLESGWTALHRAIFQGGLLLACLRCRKRRRNCICGGLVIVGFDWLIDFVIFFGCILLYGCLIDWLSKWVLVLLRHFGRLIDWLINSRSLWMDLTESTDVIVIFGGFLKISVNELECLNYLPIFFWGSGWNSHAIDRLGLIDWLNDWLYIFGSFFLTALTSLTWAFSTFLWFTSDSFELSYRC